VLLCRFTETQQHTGGFTETQQHTGGFAETQKHTGDFTETQLGAIAPIDLMAAPTTSIQKKT
jgi:hypothetical protein